MSMSSTFTLKELHFPDIFMPVLRSGVWEGHCLPLQGLPLTRQGQVLITLSRQRRQLQGKESKALYLLITVKSPTKAPQVSIFLRRPLVPEDTKGEAGRPLGKTCNSSVEVCIADTPERGGHLSQLFVAHSHYS